MNAFSPHDWTAPFAGVLLDSTLKATAILLLATGAGLLLRRRSAALRHMMWTSAVVGVLLLPLLSWALPAWRVLPWMPDVRVAAQPAHVSPSPLPAFPARDLPPRPVAAPSEVPPRLLTSAGDVRPMPSAAPTQTPPAPTSSPLVSQTPATLAEYVVCLWLAGAACMCLPMLVSMVVLRLLKNRATRVGEPWSALHMELCALLAIRRCVTLLQGGRRSAPMTFGIWRPTILVPANAWPAQRWRVVLLHELAHIQRHDCLTIFLGRLAKVVLWFHPLAWLAGRRLTIEAERACDDLVLAAGTRSSAYADELLAIATSFRGHPALEAAALTMARRSTLETRLRGILDATRNRRALTRTALLAGLILMAAVVLPLACLKAASPVATAPAPVPAAGATLAGEVHVLPNGKIAAGVTVSLVDLSKPEAPARTTRTDAEGYYEFNDVPYASMAYLVQVGEQDRKGGIWSDDARIHFSAEQAAARVRLTLATLYTRLTPVTGHVIDKDTGKPAAGVEIRFTTLDKNFHSVITNEKGEFRLNVSPRDIVIECYGSEDRYYPTDAAGKTVTVKDGQPQTLDFTVKSAPGFAGQVLTPDGGPAAKLPVLVYVQWGTSQGPGRIAAARRRLGLPAAKPRPETGAIDAYGIGHECRITTDDQGRFQIYLRRFIERDWDEDINIGIFARTADRTLGAFLPLQTTTLEPNLPPAQLRLAPTASVEFAVLPPAGAPPGVPIDAKPDFSIWHERDNLSILGDQAHIKLDIASLGNNRYRAQGLIPGAEYRFRVQGGGYTRALPTGGTADEFSVTPKPGEKIIGKELRMVATSQPAPATTQAAAGGGANVLAGTAVTRAIDKSRASDSVTIMTDRSITYWNPEMGVIDPAVILTLTNAELSANHLTLDDVRQQLAKQNLTPRNVEVLADSVVLTFPRYVTTPQNVIGGKVAPLPDIRPERGDFTLNDVSPSMVRLPSLGTISITNQSGRPYLGDMSGGVVSLLANTPVLPTSLRPQPAWTSGRIVPSSIALPATAPAGTPSWADFQALLGKPFDSRVVQAFADKYKLSVYRKFDQGGYDGGGQPFSLGFHDNRIDSVSVTINRSPTGADVKASVYAGPLPGGVLPTDHPDDVIRRLGPPKQRPRVDDLRYDNPPLSFFFDDPGHTLREIYFSQKYFAPPEEPLISTREIGDELLNQKEIVKVTADQAPLIFAAGPTHLRADWRTHLPEQIGGVINGPGPQSPPSTPAYSPPKDTEPHAQVTGFTSKILFISIYRPAGNYLWHAYLDEIAHVMVPRTPELDKIFDLPSLESTYGATYKGLRQGDTHTTVIETLGPPEKTEPTQAVNYTHLIYAGGTVRIDMLDNSIQSFHIAAPATRP